ncbi:MAG: 50S ribosomal protein L18 [Patescibacteria group bacterium]
MKRSEIIAKRAQAERRAKRVRAKIVGTPARPRLSVFRSIKHISAQFIDDQTGRTLLSAGDLADKLTGKPSDRAAAVGKLIAERALAKGIDTVIFDRGSYLFHGRVKALAEAARAGGIKF